MNKLTFQFLIFSVFALSAAAAYGQISKIDPNAGRRAIVVTDNSFETQKSKPILSTRPQIGYEVWITTNGILHCKTNSTLTSASIKFTAPTVSSTNANGDTTGTGGDVSRKFELNKPENSDAYLFNIVLDKYKEKHAISLMITSTSGSKAEVTLINKKVPAEIEK